MTWLTDLGEYLEDQNFGTIGSNIFYGDFKAGVPNCIALNGSTGRSTKTTLKKTMTLERPELQVKVRNLSNKLANQKSESIEKLLDLTFNTFIGATRFKSIKANAPHFFVEQSQTEGYTYSVYFSLEIG